MLTERQFELLRALAEGAFGSEAVVQPCHTDNDNETAVRELTDAGLAADGAITQAGLDALEPYRVRNAVIMAAGLSSRFAPISYEKPKGVLIVRGEVLIERQIEQLREAGVRDITVVVGYKKEYFFYLARKLGVRIVVNPEFASRNNHASLMVARKHLGNTYICSSDDYFLDNPFHQYEYRPFYAATYIEGPTKEWCIGTNADGVIESVAVGGSDSWVMLGHAYFGQAFSKRFVEVLEEEYDLPETADKLWEELYLEHVDELPMVVRRYEPGFVNEFDSLDELRDFDPYFLRNVDSQAFDNIVAVLGCPIEDVHDVYPLKQGLTNLSCHFAVGDKEYVYRHPGVGTELIIDREAELVAQSVAKTLGIDDTYIYQDAQTGWKISRFIPNASPLDPADAGQVRRAMQMARRLHESPMTVQREFDFYRESLKYERLYEEIEGPVNIGGFREMADKVARLAAYVEADGAKHCLTHNDFFNLNFLIDASDKMYLIDWEYSGMSDYASDFGTFVVCCELDRDQAETALADYFDRPATPEEWRHNFAHVVLAGWCWYLWSLYKEAQGECVGEWIYIYYNYADAYLDEVLAAYEAAEADRA